MSAFLSRVDIVDDDEEPHVPPLLKLTVTEEIEALNTSRELHIDESLYGLNHDSVTERGTYLQYMITMMVRTIEAKYGIEVDGAQLESVEIINLLNRFDKKEKQ